MYVDVSMDLLLVQWMVAPESTTHVCLDECLDLDVLGGGDVRSMCANAGLS